MLIACLQMHEGYSELVKGLLEKMTLDHTTSVSITALAFDPAPANAEVRHSSPASSCRGPARTGCGVHRLQATVQSGMTCHAAC